MRILHYFLGFPPYRTGGLTKYAFDLMKSQSIDNHTVFALWPGQMNIMSNVIRIRSRRNINGIESFELINPLPVSLDEGVAVVDEFMKSCNPDIYKGFLMKIKPDVIHIHTLMGVHKEFIDVAQELHIRTVYTSHDYFGICPKATLYRYGATCDDDHGCKDCIQCNRNGLPLNKIKIIQSPMYRKIKNSALVKQLRKQHREDFFANEVVPEMPVDIDVQVASKQYQKLREYYIGMLKSVDLLHFNSTVSESVYTKYFTPKNSQVMTISHQNIADNRKVNKWEPEEKMKITFLSPAKPFKGFNVLKAALDELWDSGQHDFELMMFSPVRNPAPYMKIKEEGYTYEQLKDILNNSDVVVAPSVCKETFGFTVLEALSYGVPVIVSDHVGAKDIVGNGGIVVEAGDKIALKEAISSLNKSKLQKLRNIIQKEIEIKVWRELLNENYELYNS